MFKLSVCDQGLVISDDKISAVIPPSTALKESLWLLINEEIKTMEFKDEKGTTITLSDLTPNDINLIRNFITEHLV